MLNFADRTRRGVFMAVWPQMKERVCNSFMYPSHTLAKDDIYASEVCGGRELALLGHQ